MKTLTIFLILSMVTLAFSQNSIDYDYEQPKKCKDLTKCKDCASQKACIWCNGSNKCLDSNNFKNAAWSCKVGGGKSLVITGSGCSKCS